MELLAIPALSDNYIWLLHDGGHALVVDPGQAEPVSRVLKERGLVLDLIVVTHHHADHTGGVATLRDASGARVHGPAREAIPQPASPLAEGDRLDWRGLHIEVIDTPGHTAGHISLVARHAGNEAAPWLFCGDTLFSGGCGRLLEGTPAQMLASLDKFEALPGGTQVCAAHEYTLANLDFARAVEPGNRDLIDYEDACRQRRARQAPTLPSTLALERRINPFLRSRLPSVRQSVQARDASARDEVSAFAALRQWKNDYK
ncbi:MAG: hydroxyacylglutathione hydrolase [Comamonas sp.]